MTPFVQLWGHAQRSIELALVNRAKVRFIVRSDGGDKQMESIAWLLEHGVEVLAVDGLHAKIYMNENAIIVSSMNFYGYSTDNAMETGLMIVSAADARALRAYVSTKLMSFATPLSLAGSRATFAPQRQSKLAERTATGHCIRRGEDLRYDPARPLCDNCYEIWAEYGDENYSEKFCHAYGQPAKVTKAQTLCVKCRRQR